MSGNEAYGLTISLLLTSDGKKMGKTESGAVWLDPLKTSPFDFFQFWRNVSDAEVISCLKMLTFITLEEIDSMDMSHATGINEAKKKLAFEVTKIVHGEEVAKEVLTQASNLFEKKMDDAMVSVDVDTGCSVIEAMIKAGFAKSKTDARNLISGKGVFINDELCDLEFKINKECVLRKGKKHFCKLKIL
jgi:tyrosyl-tRNA synthetase